MDLPSFLWLWKIAAWSMGLSLTAYCTLGLSGLWMRWGRSHPTAPLWLRPLHLTIGITLVLLVLLLLSIGIVGTLGQYGSLGHSWHLGAGLIVVALVLSSAATGLNVGRRPWVRPLHLSINGVLFAGFLWVSWTGWAVVQKYLPGSTL
ncbi:DUF4079 domain-containing protein [Spirulina major]|uniref:DUF4079 domain-containing protein n=1 Tax=Spirulina major TaxID=270636 RepID=UPI000934D983|nr:DUF4079 domain-containing protein [Spirulina major]